MIRETDPEALREKANALLRRAKEIEEKRFIQAGKMIHQYCKNDFKDFDMQRFKKQVKDILSFKKESPRNNGNENV